jgi:hypothetical protein
LNELWFEDFIEQKGWEKRRETWWIEKIDAIRRELQGKICMRADDRSDSNSI